MEQDIAALELVEVRKLHELVRRLEIQNESLSERRRNINTNNQALSGVLISCPSSLEESQNCCDLLDPEPADVNGGDGISPPPLESPRDTLVGQDGHVYDGCYAHLPHSNILEETHRQGCLGSEELVDRDTEKRAEQSSLELVDLLDLEEGCEVENEVSWLYESPKKRASAEGSDESPLKWCRQVLDNPSPETEVACRTLINILDQKTRWRSFFSSRSHRHPVAFPDTGYLCMGSPSPRYHRSTDRSQQTNKPNSSVYHDLLSVWELTQYVVVEGLRSNMYNLDSTPPRTSLRSLQAVRTSRNLEANGQLLTDHPTSRLTFPVAGSTRSPPGESSVKLRSGGRSSSVSAKILSSSDPATGAARQSLRESFQASSIRGLPRVQSFSPSGLRIPCPSKDFSVGGYLSSHGRVYTSPERSTTLAWGRLGQPANAHRSSNFS
ncbi:unnamed protein product [Coregonus sp. 'balchen']|nr:unnamed protein product [Coregonus sp. 'balchen']